MMLRKINGVAKANGLEDRVDIVISVFTLARNGKSNIDFTATELLKTFTLIASFVTYRIYAIYMFILYSYKVIENNH